MSKRDFIVIFDVKKRKKNGVKNWVLNTKQDSSPKKERKKSPKQDIIIQNWIDLKIQIKFTFNLPKTAPSLLW